MNNRLINTKVAGGGGCTDIVDNYDPFGGNGVALYQLNGNANDVSGNYNGTATNVTYGTGVFGQAGVFNGSSSEISIPNGVSGTGAFSVSVWINSSNITTAEGIWSIGLSGASNPYAESFIENGIVYFRVRTATVSYFFASTTSGDISANTWHNIVYVFPNTTATNGCKIYIDGQEVAAETSTTGSLTRDNTNNGIGSRFTGGAGGVIPFSGSIDQVRIFDTALDPLEVEALYTEELCICDGTVDTLQVLGDTSCIATYQLDGNANDLSGNYSGTPTDVSYGVGEFDLAGVFNGTSSWLETGISLYQQSFTLSGWFNINSFDTSPYSAQRLFSIFISSVNDFWLDILTDKTLRVIMDGATALSSSALTTTNTWYHICYTRNYSTGNAALYVNGVSQDSATDHNRPLLTNTMQIGRAENDTSYFDGSIDQVRIFNKALDQNEVDILFAESACTKAACTGTTHTLNILGGGDTSCIAAYPLDGSPADLSGNYNGVQVDSVNYRQGEFDLCGYFTGGYIQLPSNPITGSNPRTVSFWVNDPSLSDSNVIYSGGNDLSLQAFAVILLNDGRVRFYGGANGGTSTSNSVISINTWYHIAVTYDGGALSTSSINIYVNGSLQAAIKEGTVTGVLNTGTEAARIANPGLGTNILIDQVRVFNKALNSTEVGILFNDETPCN